MAAAPPPLTAAGAPLTLHATAVAIGERGILIEGASGAGKSTLAAALIAEATAAQRFGRLIGDDRLVLTAAHGRIVARPHAAIAGLIELRGLGLVPVDHEPAALLHLAVEITALSGAVERLPAEPRIRELGGAYLPLLVLPAVAGPTVNAQRVMAALILWASAFSNGSNQLANSLAMHKIAPHDVASGAVRSQIER